MYGHNPVNRFSVKPKQLSLSTLIEVFGMVALIPGIKAFSRLPRNFQIQKNGLKSTVFQNS